MAARDLALAVDIGGTKIEAALVDGSGAVLASSRRRHASGRAATSTELDAALAAAVAETLLELPADAALLGVGIGAAGPLDAQPGHISPLNLPAWRGYDVVGRVRGLVPGVPVRLAVDGACIALAEHWIGAAQGVTHFLGMVVSTGIGGGLILDGRLMQGASGNAGHIGHVAVGGESVRCSCGGLGCVEAVASGPRSVEWARARGWTGNSGEELGASYREGDEIAIAAVHRAGVSIGRALASATSLLDLELVAIGGGFSHVTPDLFGFIREGLDERHEFEFVRRLKVVPSALALDGPLIGAAALIHTSTVTPLVE
ncbi:MAG TPA: ROK family protein [Galbitalea sp.]|jgi:glucokinase